MKGILFVILIIMALLFFTTPQSDENQMQLEEEPKKTYHDTPINNYEQRIEAQNIANTIQSPSSYMSSRIDARGEAKKALEISNQQAKAREKALESF